MRYMLKASQQAELATPIFQLKKVKTWVDDERSVKYSGPDIASRVKLDGFAGQWEQTFGRVCDMFFHVIRIVAPCSSCLEFVFECLTEGVGSWLWRSSRESGLT